MPKCDTQWTLVKVNFWSFTFIQLVNLTLHLSKCVQINPSSARVFANHLTSASTQHRWIKKLETEQRFIANNSPPLLPYKAQLNSFVLLNPKPPPTFEQHRSLQDFQCNFFPHQKFSTTMSNSCKMDLGSMKLLRGSLCDRLMADPDFFRSIGQKQF